MEKPKELRRLYFKERDVAEVLVGPAGRSAKISISRSPKISITVTPQGEAPKVFDEEKIVEQLCIAIKPTGIPIPRGGNKRIIIDRNREESIILQFGFGILF